jgi:anti-sigma factor RsiW
MKPSDSLPPTGDHADIAGYLLKSLTPDETQRVEDHLAECAECRTEVDALREWTAALEAVPEAMTLDGPPDDADLLLQRTLREMRAESSGRRHRRTGVLVGAAAAVIAVAIGGGVLAGRSTAPDRPLAQPTAGPQASTVPGTRVGSVTDPATGAQMSVALVPAAGWVRVTARVGGIPSGERCELQVVGNNGKPVVAGSWLVSGATTLNGSALIDPAQVTSVRVVNAAGKQYVSVPV